ncbi:LLM class flavin-dependent oxidoreductase [Mycetocola tolaasinivorans]|uniref:LLM class flavin-dependent oxidoreductase n=1 Tax=Mycetocola tolaasinivorans TaxID=76635 RepID=A0A3L7ABD1_9MICO|nr:LLM class flavin-dependent oxidoreductase [Mycetocola tolaasinivorans]RLP76971.1 LLM class flavin-dependent oxidoreductase [Mycetocola tolaasinivorans]
MTAPTPTPTGRPPFVAGLVLDTGAPLAPGTPSDTRFDRSYWAGLVHAAEAGGFDQVVIAGAPSAANGGFDPLLLASSLAPLTTRIALVPEIVTGVREPFHIAAAVQTLDHLSRGRAGWLVSPGPAGAGGYLEDLADARETVEAARALFDSWEDDAEIRDVATGRYIDRERVHDVEYAGTRFSIHGASYVPRSPQGSPPVFVRISALPSAGATGAREARAEREFARASADTIIVDATGLNVAGLDATGVDVAEPEASAGHRGAAGVVEALIADLRGAADASAPTAAPRILVEVTPPHDPADLVAFAETVAGWYRIGAAGVLLRPSLLPASPADLETRLLTELWAQGLPAPQTGDQVRLRALLGLASATNRFAAARNEKAGVSLER